MAKMTQEEIDAMEAEIPEWKKGALVLQDDEEEEKEAPSRFRQARDMIRQKIDSTE